MMTGACFDDFKICQNVFVKERQYSYNLNMNVWKQPHLRKFVWTEWFCNDGAYK